MITIQINADALEALRLHGDFGANEVGHDTFEDEVSHRNHARLIALQLPQETLSDTIVRLSVAGKMVGGKQ